MPKTKAMKATKAKPAFPDVKRGKLRVQRRPAAKKFVPVPYVRHGIPSSKNKAHRARWGRSIHMLMSFTGKRLIQLLQKDGILRHWKGRSCPRCGNGTLGKLSYINGKNVWAYRCNSKKCHKYLQPHDFHPIFFMGAGNSVTPLNQQAAALYCAVANVPCQSAHLILDMDHKPVERIYANLDISRARYVTAKENLISYGGNWQDVEVDEVDIGKSTDETSNSTYNTTWEQWGGLVERGRPSSLRLFRLNPRVTRKRAPGPGPITKRDWAPVGKKLLANRKVVLHSDGARAYKLKLPDVLHCNVVHQKKKIQINGKAVFSKANMIHSLVCHALEMSCGKCTGKVGQAALHHKVYDLNLPDGSRLKVKSGTQIIDRFWGHLRNYLKNSGRIPGSAALTRKVRAAQFTYWHRSHNMWQATGTMLRALQEQV